MLDLSKPVRMKNETPVEILTTCLMGSYPVLGKIQHGKYCLWKRDGVCLPGYHPPGNDLENVPEERKVWLNVYENMICLYSSREEADDLKVVARLARLKVTLKDVEGRFDE